MSTTAQSAMADVSPTGNAFLQTSTSVSENDPEMDSINFRESLRFFQEQLRNAKKDTLPNGNSLKCIKFNGKRNSVDNLDAPKVVDTSEDITVVYTNSQITPIPTVDTILESVRILRAIQKSQSQRGSLWTLDITSSNADALESYKALEIELQKSLTEVGSRPASASEDTDHDTDVISPMPVVNTDNSTSSNAAQYNVDIDGNSGSCVFWPKIASVEVEPHVNDSQIDAHSDDGHTPTYQIANTSTPSASDCESINNHTYAVKNYEEFESHQPGGILPKDLPESGDSGGYPQSDDPEESVEDYLSCCSFSLQDDNSEPKLDLLHGERSTSTESDSGMGTDKSVGSLSPVRGEDSEKNMWIESSSSEYASADCSPCASLTRVPEEHLSSTEFEATELQATALDDEKHDPISDAKTDDIVCDNLKSNSDHPVPKDHAVFASRKDENGSMEETSSAVTLTELSHNSRTALYGNGDLQASGDHPMIDDHSVFVSSKDENEYMEATSSPMSLTKDLHSSRTVLHDDLVTSSDNSVFKPSKNENESIEASPSPITLTKVSQNSKTVLNKPGLVSESSECDMSRERLVEILEDKIEQLELSPNHDVVSDSQNNRTSIALATDAIDQNSDLKAVPCNEVDEHLVSCGNELPMEQSSQLPGEVEHPCEILEPPFQSEDKEVYISSVEYKLTNSELELPETNENEEEDTRPKKTGTITWDPVPLVEHLYSKKGWELPSAEDSIQKRENVEGYVNLLPCGAFPAGGEFFSAVDNGCFDFWKSEEKQQLITSLPLQYAVVETDENNTLILDNRLGRNVKIKYESENEFSRWKHILQSHSTPTPTTKFLEPVHYPLKCHKNVIIVDLGSCSTRAGILMDQPTLPNIFFPTVCATCKTTGKQLYGMDALLPEIRQNSTLSYPVRPSPKITKFTMDIDVLKGLFQTIFRKLNVDPKEYAIQICIPRSLSTNTQAELVKLLLGSLGMKAVSLTRQSLLTLYANNTSTAIVVDIGERMDVLPVVDGFILETGVSRLPYGGQRIIHHMKHALAQKHISLSNDVESLVVQYIFENLCYIAENYDHELHNATLNPGAIKKSLLLHPFFKGENILKTVTLDIGRFQVPEGLFNPDLWGVDFPGLHKLVHQAIQTSGMDVRRLMAENIYVSGGVTLIPGFVERLQKEVAKLTLPRLKPQVHASPYRYHMAYLGACQLAISDAFPQVCITPKEWQEKGLTCLSKWHL